MSTLSDVTTKLGRVQLVKGTPQMLPGKCVICGTSGDSESEFIDTGWDIDFYGVVYFCKNCIREAAAVLSMVPTEKLSEALEALGVEQFKREALEDENEKLRKVISDLRSIGFSAGSDESNSDSSESTVDEESKESEPISGSTSKTKSGSSKSSHESRSSSVRNNDSSATDSIIADL